MKHSRGVLLSFSGAVMEFTWLYAWAMFATISIAQRSFPFSEAVIIFLAAIAVTGLSAGRGLRIITVLLIQTAGFACAALRTIYCFSEPASGFFGLRWVAVFFGASHSTMVWFTLVAAVFWAWALWTGGALFAVRPKTYGKICSRFDMGLAAFFCLVLLKFALQVKGNISINAPLTGPLACIFFCFGLASIGMARGQSTAFSGSISGHRRFGIVIGFIGIVFLSVISLVIFLQQPLAGAARFSYGLIKSGASSLGMIFINFIRFLYLPRHARVSEPPSGGSGGPSGQLAHYDSTGWIEVVGKILGWLFGTVLGLIVLAVIVFSAIYLIKWLLSRTPSDGNKKHGAASFPNIFEHLRKLVVNIFRKARRIFRGYRTATDLYGALSGWAWRSGISRRPNETPLEFYLRLAGYFPALNKEIYIITTAFNREFYGEAVLGKAEIALAGKALRKLRSPGIWPLRLKAFFSDAINPLL